jgi:hypothetical protein
MSCSLSMFIALLPWSYYLTKWAKILHILSLEDDSHNHVKFDTLYKDGQSFHRLSDEDMASTHMTMLGELHGGQGDQQGHPNREGGPKLIRFESPRWRPKSSSSPPRNPGLVCLELVTQDTFGLCFRWSIYGWKAYLIRKPIQVVPRQKLFGINGNRRNKSLSRIYQGAVSPSFGLFGPCNVSALPRDANRGPLTSLSLYNQ